MYKLKRWIKFFVLGGKQSFHRALDKLNDHDKLLDFYENLHKVYSGAPLKYMELEVLHKMILLLEQECSARISELKANG